MKNYCWLSLYLLLLVITMLSFPTAFCEEQTYQLQDNSYHDDHLNDATDDFPNDYTPLTIPIADGKQITVAPAITCTALENGTWHPHHHLCKLAQTLLVDDDWTDGNANYTYIFEDWTDYDWNDIIVNLYASISYGFFSDLSLVFREAAWKNPFSLEITAEGTWIKIEWNSTDYPNMNSLTVDEGETVVIELFPESNASDTAFIRFLIPPSASFAWYPMEPSVGATVLFDASASYDPDKKIETYSWVFSDGTSVTTDTETITHSFNSTGIYSVNLTVADIDGLTDVMSKHIQVVAIVGGETTPISIPIKPVWKYINILLIIAFAAVTALIKRKGIQRN